MHLMKIKIAEIHFKDQKIEDYAITRFSTKTGVNGEGELVEIEFKALKSGKAVINYALGLFDANVNNIFYCFY